MKDEASRNNYRGKYYETQQHVYQTDSFFHQSQKFNLVFVFQKTGSFFKANHKLNLRYCLLSNQTNEGKVVHVASVESDIVVCLSLILVKNSKSDLIHYARKSHYQSENIKKARQEHLVPLLSYEVPVDIV